MFREIILPIFRSTRLCVTACGIMHPRCCRPPATSVTGGMCETSGECSFGQTIPIQPKTPISKDERLRIYWPEKRVDFFGVYVVYLSVTSYSPYLKWIPMLSLDAAPAILTTGKPLRAYSGWKSMDYYDTWASVFVVPFNGFMSLTSYFDVMYRY